MASRTRGVVALLVAAALSTAAACAPAPPPPAAGTNPNDAPRAGEAAYIERGPFAVGVTTVQLDDRAMELWYPVDPDDVGDEPLDEYHIRDFVSSAIDRLIPADVDPPYVTDAIRDLPSSDAGPFPLVLFSHGFASYRLQSTFLTTHLASWGFVVASPDYLERGLRAVLGEPPRRSRSDTSVAAEAIDVVRSLADTPGSLLEGKVRTDLVHPIGHSAGGGTSLRLLDRDDVTGAIPLASGLALLTLLSDGPPTAGKAVTWVAAPRDRIVSIDDVRRGYQYTSGPRRLFEIGGSGHVNAFSDICEIGDGGVAALARAAGLPIPEPLLALGDDGCPVPPFRDSPEVWPEVRHVVTAQLRLQSGVDAEPVGLGDQVLDEFDDIVRYRHNP